MKNLKTILALALVIVFAGCRNHKPEEKGFQVSSTTENTEDRDDDNGLHRDSMKIVTRPGSILLTGTSNIRLTTVFKVNINKRDNSSFIGSNCFHNRYEETEGVSANNWNNHIMPGLEAVYGYNIVNVSLYNISENKQKNLFDKPVLVKTLYFPSYQTDTLNFKPVNRNYIIVTVYNDDTNKDGFINLKDLRRMYLFNINGEKQKALIPENYSVIKSEYDPGNDFMFVYAQPDINGNGQKDDSEPVHIFWIDLKNPDRTGRQY